MPTALALALGILARQQEFPLWSLLVLLPSVWLLRPVLLARTPPSRADSLPPRRRLTQRRLTQLRLTQPRYSRMPARAWLALLLPVLACLLGYLRFDQWSGRPDPLAGLRDRELRLEGVSDGRLLELAQPSGVRLAIAPAGAVPAGRVELLGTIREAQGRRNPGGFDYRGYLRRRGVDGQLFVAEVMAAEQQVSQSAKFRDRLRRGVRRGLPEREAALLEAMSLGIRDELGELRETFAAAGLAHVLALSGLHVGLLLAAAGWLLGPLGLQRYPALLGLDFGYMLLVGATPSVVRASLMAAAVLLGLWLGAGRLQPWTALGTSALVTLLARPSWLFDLSFQLSYGAVAGILLFAAPFAVRLRGWPQLPWWHPRVAIGGSLLVSAAAQSLTLPLVASSFASVPLLSPLVNVVALPLASLLVPLGFLAGVLGLLSLPLAGGLNIVTGVIAQALITVADLGARLPALTWGAVEPIGFVYYALALSALALAAAGRLKPRLALLNVLLAVTLSHATPSMHPQAELVAFDVGQGDSLLLRLPGRIEVLVDGGGSPFSSFDVGEAVVLPALRALGVDELELVIASHPDVDHIEGLPSVLRAMPVQLLAYGVAAPEREAFRELMAAANDRNVTVRQLIRGERIVLPGAVLEVLNPPVTGYGDSNDDSVALALYLAGTARALLLGDVSDLVERDLTPPEVDVLVAPHHGSAGSSSVGLLNATRPRHVVVSVGRNRYGHPSPSVLARLRAVGATVHTTMEAGAVRLPLSP